MRFFTAVWRYTRNALCRKISRRSLTSLGGM